MQLRCHPGVVLPQGPAPVDQHPQHGELLVVDDGAQPGHPDPDQSDGVCVCGVGLAALPGGEHRTRADSRGGTSMTCSPSASSRNAT